MDSSNGLGGQGTDTHVSPGAPTVTEAPKAPVAAEERTFRQSEVNEIVKKAKYGAVEDFRRMQTEQPQYAQTKYGNEPDRSNQFQQQHSPAPDEQAYRKIAAEEAQRLRDQWMDESRQRVETENAQRIVGNFWNKVASGRNKYQDFDQVVGGVKLEKYPNVVAMLSDVVENADDMMFHLGKNEAKMAELERLAEDPRFQHIAIAQAKQLSQSLKDNETASNIRTPNEPLSQMRPSTTGTSNGVLGVGDYRKKWKV